MRRACVVGVFLLAIPLGGAVRITDAEARASAPEGVGPPDGAGPPWATNCGDDDDAYEGPAGNDTIHTPHRLAYDGTYTYEYYDEHSAWVSVEDAFLCSGNSDWFRLPRPFDTEMDEVMVMVRAQANGAPLCYGCGEEGELAPAPENTLSVDVHQATGQQPLLGTRTSTRGSTKLDSSSAAYEDGLLLRFYGPPEAQYDYRFTVTVQDWDGEDECEC